MKKHLLSSVKQLKYVVVLLLLASGGVFGQLTGTKSIPTDYTSLALFVADLNTNGVGAGGVTLNIPSGYAETLTAQLTISATGTAANPIVIQKSGTGANPLFTSYVGTNTPTSASRDGMICLSGTDYLTIDGLDLVESSLNTTETTCMEYGIGLFKVDGTNGSQNNTIKNCGITLNRLSNTTWTGTGHTGSCGIVMLNCANSANAALTTTVASGSNSNNKFQGNTVQNVNAGIVFIGFAAPSPFALGDQANSIGGTIALEGNSVLNFGGSTGATNPSTGIFANNQWDLNCSYNTVNNNNGSGVNHVSTLRGIFMNISSTSASANCNNNNITLQSGATTSQLSGIENGFGSTAAGNTVNINNNTITGSYLTATSATFYGIYSTSSPTTINIQNNTISNFTYSSIANTGSGANYMIYSSGAAVNVNLKNNNVNNITRTGTSGGTTYCVYAGGGTNQKIKNNTVSDISIDGTGTSGAIYALYSTTGVIEVDSNTVFNLLNNKTTGTGVIYGIYNLSSPTNENYRSNTVYNLLHSGTGTVNGAITNTAAGTRTFSNNLIYNLSTGGNTVVGYQSTNSSPSIFNNKIYGLTGGGTAPTVAGLAITSVGASGAANVYNNYIGNLNAPNANTTSNTAPSVRGINLTSSTATSTISVRYNTIHLNATSTGANFSTAALFQTSSTTATTANLTLNNNIFSNQSTANGTGLSMAYCRGASTGTNFNIASNNNDYYAGSPSSSNLIYFDGTNAAQTIPSYQVLVSGADANSISVAPTFVSTTGSASTYLHINTTVPTLLESGGANIAGITSDFDGDTRAGNVGYAGTGTNPDMGADEFEGTVPPVCTGTPTAGTISSTLSTMCAGSSSTLTLPGSTNALNITYQWKSSTTAGGPYTNVGTASGYSTGTIPTTTFYVADVTCSTSGLTATTPEISVVVNPNPVVAIASASNNVCLGSTMSMTASGADTYVWTPANTLSSSTAETVVATPTVNTIYTVVGTYTATGCFATTTKTLSVLSVPNIASVTATPANVCAGDSSELQVNMAPFLANNLVFTSGTGATLDPMTGAVTLCTSSNDDTPSSLTAIGFSFPFNGSAYTDFSVSPDGFIKLGSPVAVSQFTNATTSTTNLPKIYPYWDDMATGTTGSVTSVVTGTAPNRILKVQWFVTVPRNTGGAANSTFQAWLYETSGQIEFRYGTFGTQTAGTASVGLTGAATVYQSITLATNAVSTTAANDVNPGVPVSGGMYTFAVPTYTYAWTPTTNLSNATIVNPIATNVTGSTTYTATVTSSNGCPSSAPVTLNVALPSTGSVTQNSCGAYTWPVTGLTYNFSGTYTGVLPNAVGCDSTITLNLTVNPLTTSTITAVSCGAYTSPSGEIFTTSGTYNDTLISSSGCPIVLIINLTVNNASTSTISPTVCNTYTAPDGTVYTSSGTYEAILVNSNGCDSVITINLTVNHATTSTISPVVCGTYTSPTGVVYTTSGTYSSTIPNSVGCDSIITIQLTVNNETSSTVSASVCDSYTSPSGTVYTASGVYTDVIPNAAGCDSTITLNVTILTPSTSTITETACGSYTAPSGAVYGLSGTYTDIVPNAAGCDSVITINLTLTPVLDLSVVQNGTVLVSGQGGAVYQWIDCDAGNVTIAGETAQTLIVPANGNYAVIVQKGSCTADTSACFNVNNVGIAAILSGTEFTMSPNPTNDFVKVQFDDLTNVNIEIMDAQGKLVQSKLPVFSGEVLDFTTFERGVYFVRVYSSEGNTVQRIVKN